MIITATLEVIETGEVEATTVECTDYTAGFEQLRRTVPEGIGSAPGFVDSLT